MLVVCRVLQGLGAGALQPTEQAILRQTFPPEEQGMAMALFGMAVMLGPAFGPTLGGYIVDNYELAVDLLHQPAGRAPRPLHGARRSCTSRRTSAQANLAAAAKQRKHMDWAGIALLTRRAGVAAVRARRGHRNDWFESTRHLGARRHRGRRAAAFVIRELTATDAGGEPVAVQGPRLPRRHAHRRRDVRDADVGHVPPAGVHAGAARLRRDAVGHGADAALARDDGRHRPIVGRIYNKVSAAHRRRVRRSSASRSAPT